MRVYNLNETYKVSIFSKTYYGQFTAHTKDVHKYDSSHRSDSRNMENVDSSDTMIPTDTIKVINGTALDQLVD